MKVFIRSIKGSDCSSFVNKIDYLSTEEYNKTTIYKIDISIEENSQFSGSIINNITTSQNLIVNNQSITISPGFYSLENLFAIINKQSIAISLIKNEENAYHTKTLTTFDFSKAREIQEILGFDSSQESASGSYKLIVPSETISTNPANITRGVNVIQLYSSITNSDTDIPIVTIKIDNPLESFHQSYETNINVKNSVLNYIDVHFRDIAGNLITLNGNITINFYFKTDNQFDYLENNNNRFNITSQITNLDNGHYSHKLSRPIYLTNSKIVNANFLTNGSIYNLSTDQTVVIDGIPFIVQKGSYTLEEILSVMNNLTGAVFSYINSGENCYKIQIDNISSIKFITPELANMLGFELNLYETANIVERYQLTSNNNVFKLKINDGSWILTVEPGIYSEQEFFKKLQEAIYPYDNSVKIEIHDYYVEFVNSSGLTIENISSTESVYNNRLEQYHWFQGFNKRNNDGREYFTIARYNCFYLKTTGTDNRYHENIYFARHNHMKDNGLIAKFSDGTSKSYDLTKLAEEKYFYLEDVAKTIYNALLSDHFHFRSSIAEGSFKHRRVNFVSKSGVSVYFTGASSFIDYMNLPTTATTSFEFYCYNKYIGHLKTKGETIGFRCSYDNTWHDLVIVDDYNLAKLCFQIREWISNTLQAKMGIKGHGYLYYYNVFCGSFLKSDLLNNCEWIQYRGSLIDKKILTGFNTEQKPPADMLIYTNYVNTFNIDLGYTSCDELQQCIENRLEEYNYNFQVNPHYHSYADDSTVRVENNFHVLSFKIPGLDYIDYDNDETYYHVRVFSNGYNKYIFNNPVTLTTKIDGFTTTFTIQNGFYNQASLFKTINNFIVNQGLYFIKRSTYYALVKNNKNITISGTICDYVNFVNTSSEIRVFYDDKAVLDLSSICSNYPCNITNGFNLINVFSNLCDTRKNNDNYLTSFVISKSNGINVSNAGIRNNYSNSNSTLDRYISDSNINQIDYYFERENGEPFTFNGIIVANIEIVSEQ